jgi:lipoprotein-anchoring transpeptidase ErfK/SrfK
VPAAGISAGDGRTFADDFTVKFSTGAAIIATVLDAKHQITVTADGKWAGSFPVSLGAATTPTSSGTKVVMAKGTPICMSGPGYNTCDIQFTQKLTDSGEYLMAAPWNTKNIDQGIDSSNGCINLNKNDAARLYSMMEVGDVVNFPQTDGPAMSVNDGLGDWNVPWKVWLLGGLVPTH